MFNIIIRSTSTTIDTGTNLDLLHTERGTGSRASTQENSNNNIILWKVVRRGIFFF